MVLFISVALKDKILGFCFIPVIFLPQSYHLRTKFVSRSKWGSQQTTDFFELKIEI